MFNESEKILLKWLHLNPDAFTDIFYFNLFNLTFGLSRFNSLFGTFNISGTFGQSILADWPELPIQTFNTPSGNDFQPRKREFQGSLVETTLDPRALTFDLQQVETVS